MCFLSHAFACLVGSNDFFGLSGLRPGTVSVSLFSPSHAFRMLGGLKWTRTTDLTLIRRAL